MSARIRGKEVTAKITIEGKLAEGTWTKLSNFTETPDQEIKKKPYLGEKQHDLDFQHRGWNLSFELDAEDANIMDFVQDCVERDEAGIAHPRITITVIYAFRKSGTPYKAKVYHDVFLKLDEDGASGQDEYVNQKFSGACKKRSLVPA